MIKAIAKTIVALNTNVRKEYIAAGFAWGLLLALIPVGNLLFVSLFIISFLFKTNKGAHLLSFGILKLLIPLFHGPLDALGWYILNAEGLQGFFTKLYNFPILPFTRFNNTLVAAGLAAGGVLWLPVFFLVRALIPFYRRKINPWITQTKLYRAFIKVPLVSSLARAISSASRIADGLE